MPRISKLPILTGILLCAALAFGQTTAVRITKGPVVEHTGQHSAVVAWSTNTSASTLLRYGTNPNSLTKTAQMPWGGLTHRVTVKNLQPGTTYYFQVDSGQGQGTGTAAVSQVQQFTTTGQNAYNSNGQNGYNGYYTNSYNGYNTNGQNGYYPSNNNGETQFQLTRPPAIQGINPSTAIVHWSTNLPSSSVVHYGTNPNNLNQTAEQRWGATSHSVPLNNLQPNTTYYFSVHSAQGKNAPGQAINTPPEPFTTPR